LTVPTTAKTTSLTLNAIIFATDFSLGSQNAGLYARLLAKHFSSKLVMAHAFTLSQAAMEVEVDQKLVSQQRKDLQFLLARKASPLEDKSLEIIFELEDGDPADAIPQLGDKYGPSLIALGTHGGNRIERGLIGSVAEQILRSTRWPCLTVGPRVPAVSDTGVPFARILYATDFTPAAAGAAGFAVSFAESFGAELDVLNVVPSDAIDHPERFSEIKNNFYSALDNVVSRESSSFHDSRSFVKVGKAHQQILDHIRERGVDLLVLGIRKTSHLGLQMRTSGAFQLIVDAPCPVLTITG